MCGIVGYTGTEQAAPILLYGLERLEYRGYDSAGISVYNAGKLDVIKAQGRLVNLKEKTKEGTAVAGMCGLGHTRWATHGQPSDENAHPHLSHSGRISIVHNGIIENYMTLKEMLIRNGVSFRSETDTEVIVQLIEHYDRGDLLEAVMKAVDRLEGSYAFGVMSVDEPGKLIAVRKESPLIIAYGEGANYLASDVTAVLKYTREVTYLEDGELAVITPEQVSFYDANHQPCRKSVVHIDWNIEDAQKGGYEHFMLKEIHEQPRVFRDCVFGRIRDEQVDLSESGITEEIFQPVTRICVTGCGSAYHVGMVGKYLLERYTRIPTEAILASEFRYCDPLVDEKTLLIVISQSGETADTIAAQREARRRGAKTLAVVNVVGSTIAKEADYVLYTLAGPEIAVATTKAYSAQVACLYLLTLLAARQRQTMDEAEQRRVIAALRAIPEQMNAILEDKARLQYFASRYFNSTSLFFIGRNLDYAISLEGSLKLKEISYIHSDAYAGGELKHGTISLIEPGTLVVAVATYTKLFDKILSNIKEVKARGAVILGLTLESYINDMQTVADNTFAIPATHEMLLPSLAVIPLQLFAYYVALQRGCDVDKPRNLAKSVTVE